MRVLVTGSEGTIGRAVVPLLRAAGHKVFCIDLNHTTGVEDFVRADISNWRQFAAAFDFFSGSFDVCLNLAAEFGRINGTEFTEQLWMTNCVGLRNCLRFVGSGDIGHLIHISSSEVYGEPVFKLDYDTRQVSGRLSNEPLDEELDQLGLQPLNDYAISKLANEMQLLNEPTGDWTCFRIFNAYGPGEEFTPRRSVVTQMIYRAIHGLPMTVYRDCSRDFLYIDDLAKTLRNAVERCDTLRGEFINIGGGNPTSIGALADMVLEKVGLDGAQWIMQRTEGGNSVHKTPCLKKVQRLLDHQNTVDLSDGLDRTIEWQRATYLGA
jgi:dTDP-glucose 4,6-dehydratase